MNHCRKVKGEQVVTLQMTQQLKTKNINVLLKRLFCRQAKANFCQRQTDCIDDEDIFHSPVGLHAFKKTLKSNISEAYKVEVHRLKD